MVCSSFMDAVRHGGWLGSSGWLCPRGWLDDPFHSSCELDHRCEPEPGRQVHLQRSHESFAHNPAVLRFDGAHDAFDHHARLERGAEHLRPSANAPPVNLRGEMTGRPIPISDEHSFFRVSARPRPALAWMRDHPPPALQSTKGDHLRMSPGQLHIWVRI